MDKELKAVPVSMAVASSGSFSPSIDSEPTQEDSVYGSCSTSRRQLFCIEPRQEPKSKDLKSKSTGHEAASIEQTSIKPIVEIKNPK